MKELFLNRKPFQQIALKVILSLLTLLISSRINFAQTLHSDLPVANGPVTAMLKDGSTLYLGGLFNYFGPSTGGGAILDSSTGIYNPNFPKVNGSINVCLPDSLGGFYIGGQFTRVGNSYRNSAAHILSDGTVDSWDPNLRATLSYGVVPGIVKTIARFGNTFYIGGIFDQVGDSARFCLAALENGKVTNWNPDPDGLISSIIPTKSIVYFGGSFSNLANKVIPRVNIAAVDAVTGFPTAWAPVVSGGNGNLLFRVQGLYLVDTTLYVWGGFSQIDSRFRYGLGALYTNATTPGSYVIPWNPQTYNWGIHSNPPWVISAFAIKGDSIFVGGNFSKFGPVPKSYIALVSKTTGQISLWKPNISGPKSSTSINTLTVNGNTLYAGGAFDSVDGVLRNNLAAFDLTTGSLSNWNPYPSDWVNTVSTFGSTVFAGGYFTSVNGTTRNGLAAIDLVSNSLLPWNPIVGGNWVTSMVVMDSSLYVGGYFSSIGGNNAQRLAAINKFTGSFIPGMPSVSYSIEDLLIYNNLLYIGGTLGTVGDSVRNGLASIDLSTKNVSAWNPNNHPLGGDYNTVNSLAIVDSTLYIGGSFGMAGDSIRQCLAAFNITTGVVLPWAPTQPGNIDGKIRKIVVSGNSVYAGGGFTKIGGIPISALAKIDRQSGVIDPWDSKLITSNSGRDGIIGINDLAIVDSLLFTVGPILSQNGIPRQGIAELNLVTALPTYQIPSMNEEVYKIVVDSATGTVYIGGAFTNFNDESQSFFAAYTDPSLSSMTSIRKGQNMPAEFSLEQNYPNPFNPTTVINFQMPAASFVTLKVYDILGNVVKTLVDDFKSQGNYSVGFDGSNLATGVYFYQLRAGTFVSTKKMLMIK